MHGGQPGVAATTVGGGAGELAVMWAGFPVLGAGAGWALVAAADWINGLRWVPWRGLFELIARQPEREATAVALALGVLAGLALAYVGTRERLIVTVDRVGLRLRREGTDRSLTRREVTAVFVDQRHLTVLGADGRELIREKSDLRRKELAAAFTGQGWPWTADDPHRDAYRLWVEGLPGLPAGADALLRARQRAVERDRHGDARELRGELARLGVLVRDDGRRQYWRIVPLRREESAGGR
ncbi:hypothetical protein ACFY3U_02585 [Micromonospora sp. NPDC000089]|uniref:YqeB family protein n=1 Tax=unclassified Micromonospora TaxID=2617518 RepID=UPI0036B7C70A